MNVDVLVDTHLLVWFLQGDERGRAAIEPLAGDATSTVSFSSMSLAEMAVKHAVGKLDLDVGRARSTMLAHGMLELPFTGSHAEQLAALPLHHRDPFDRMLIAQAMSEEMQIVTVDRAFEAYEVAIHRP